MEVQPYKKVRDDNEENYDELDFLRLLPIEIFNKELRPKILPATHIPCRMVNKHWSRLFAPVLTDPSKKVLKRDPPILFAVSRGYLSLFLWFNKTLCYTLDNKLIFYLASKNRTMNILNWFKEHEPLLLEKYSCVVSSVAARNGNVDVIEWMNNTDYQQWWGIDNCMVVARSGFVNVMEWAHQRGIMQNDIRIIIEAGKSGRIQVLNWLREKNFSFKDPTVIRNILPYATRSGHLSVLKWFEENGVRIPRVSYACDAGSTKMITST
jgi:hypothetical protein